MQALIVGEHLWDVGQEREGELTMTSPLLSREYWQDEEKTQGAFVQVHDRHGTYYRTRDRVRRTGRGRPLAYLGRVR
jgi:non-ribosomal peptide synthetase component F